MLGNLLISDATFGDATFQFQQSAKCTPNLHSNMIIMEMNNKLNVGRWRWIQ
jgi:hypothetical protein